VRGDRALVARLLVDADEPARRRVMSTGVAGAIEVGDDAETEAAAAAASALSRRAFSAERRLAVRLPTRALANMPGGTGARPTSGKSSTV
jgi:hypothetical protein